jgi:hypothetical protein
MALLLKELQQVVLHHFLPRAELLQFWQLHALQLPPYLQSP